MSRLIKLDELCKSIITQIYCCPVLARDTKVPLIRDDAWRFFVFFILVVYQNAFLPVQYFRVNAILSGKRFGSKIQECTVYSRHGGHQHRDDSLFLCDRSYNKELSSFVCERGLVSSLVFSIVRCQSFDW